MTARPLLAATLLLSVGPICNRPSSRGADLQSAFFLLGKPKRQIANLPHEKRPIANRPHEEQKRPNVLWLSCEDISCNLGCYGDKDANRPSSRGADLQSAFFLLGKPKRQIANLPHEKRPIANR